MPSITFSWQKLKSPRCWAGAFHPSEVIGWNLDGQAKVETQAHCVYMGTFLEWLIQISLLNNYALS